MKPQRKPKIANFNTNHRLMIIIISRNDKLGINLLTIAIMPMQASQARLQSAAKLHSALLQGGTRRHLAICIAGALGQANMGIATLMIANLHCWHARTTACTLTADLPEGSGRHVQARKHHLHLKPSVLPALPPHPIPHELTDQ